MDSDQLIVLPERAGPLEQLRGAIIAPRHCLLRGEAGIGKTALLRLALRGVDAVVVHGVAALSADAYAPLRVAAPSLRLSGAPNVVAQRLFAWLGPDRPLVIDDVQWCDLDTVDVLAELAYLRPFVAATRPDAANADGLLEHLSAAGPVIDLERLSRQSARRLVKHWRPRAPASDVDRAVVVAAGNPLALFVASGGATAGASASEAARHAIASVSDSAVRALARAALAGRSVHVTGAVSAELHERGLVTVTANARVRPRHDLFAQAAIEALDPAAVAALHHELALEAETDLDEARHFAAAGRPREATRAAAAAVLAAPTVAARAEALRIAATVAPADADVAKWDAAEALCQAGRYRESLDLVANLVARSAHDELVRARAHWAITESPEARKAVAAGLGFAVIDPSDAAELLSLDSRIRTREDWDLEGGRASAERAVALASTGTGPRANAARVAAHSALGLASLMAGAPGWAEALETAGALAMRESDVHNAVTVYDTMIYGQLLSGDPRLCAALVTDMVEFTEHSSAAWNRYFRATGLLVALHVEGDHEGVLREIPSFAGRQLSTRTQEMLRTVHTLALVDNGHELDAVGVATDAVDRASDDSARATALWALTDAQLAAGLHEAALQSAERCAALPVQGFPGAVNAALAGARARFEIGLPFDDSVVNATTSGFPNLRAAVDEVAGIGCEDPKEAFEHFLRAANGWSGVSSRSAARCRWFAAVAALRAGDRDRAIALLTLLEENIPAWLQRRADATRRAAEVPTTHARHDTSREVMFRVARGLTTKQIARSLAVSPATVDTHVRAAMTKYGATTRVQAAIVSLGEASEAPDEVLFVRQGVGGRCLTPGASGNERSVCLAELPDVPWRLDGWVVRGEVLESKDVPRLALARVRGAALDVAVRCDPTAEADLLEALERTGGARIVTERLDTLPSADVELLALLAGGATVRDIGSRLGYSARTVQRRLAALRHEFGVTTNREVVVAVGLR